MAESTPSQPNSEVPPPLSMKRSSSAPIEAQGWCIGLKLSLKKESLKVHCNNIELPPIVTGTIHDYNTLSKESQIWVATQNGKSNPLIDYVTLGSADNSDSLWHLIVGSLSQNIFIPANNARNDDFAHICI